MILILGGSSEIYPISQALTNKRLKVLVSTATNAHLILPQKVRRRCGRLTATEIIKLCLDANVRLMIDAGHPFAHELHANCLEASNKMELPLLRFVRPSGKLPASAIKASAHNEAAKIAFSYAGPVLLTIGSRNLAPYVLHARKTNIPILARVLNHHESIAACINAGLSEYEFIVGRGPFSVKDNTNLIHKHKAYVLVSKDSGQAGGLEAKIQAAQETNCKIIVVTRNNTAGTNGFSEINPLVTAAQIIYNSSQSIIPIDVH